MVCEEEEQGVSYTCVMWLPRGAAAEAPEMADLALESVFVKSAKKRVRKDDSEDEFDMANYDNEDDECVYGYDGEEYEYSVAPDTTLSKPVVAAIEEEDEVDLTIVKDTDLVLLVGVIDAQSQPVMETLVYSTEEHESSYHHATLMDSYVLSLAWLGVQREVVIEGADSPKRSCLVAAGTFSHNIQIFDNNVLEQHTPVAELTGGHTAAVTALAVNPSHSDFLLSGSHDSACVLWDTITHRMVRKYPKIAGDKINDVAWHPAGRCFAVASEDGSVRVVDAESGITTHVVSPSGGAASCDSLVWYRHTPDTLVMVGSDGILYQFELQGLAKQRGDPVEDVMPTCAGEPPLNRSNKDDADNDNGTQEGEDDEDMTDDSTDSGSGGGDEQDDVEHRDPVGGKLGDHAMGDGENAMKLERGTGRAMLEGGEAMGKEKGKEKKRGRGRGGKRNGGERGSRGEGDSEEDEQAISDMKMRELMREQVLPEHYKQVLDPGPSVGKSSVNVRLVREYTVVDGPLTCVADCSVPNLLVVCSEEGEAIIVDISKETPRQVLTKVFGQGTIYYVQSHPQEKCLFAFAARDIVIWDLANETVIKKCFNLPQFPAKESIQRDLT